MRCPDDLRAGLVYARVDDERRLVDHVLTPDHIALLVHQDQVADLDMCERNGERIDPEVVRELRVARANVAGDTLIKAETAKQAQRCREPFLAVSALLRRVGIPSRRDLLIAFEEFRFGYRLQVLGRQRLPGHHDAALVLSRTESCLVISRLMAKEKLNVTAVTPQFDLEGIPGAVWDGAPKASSRQIKPAMAILFSLGDSLRFLVNYLPSPDCMRLSP